MAKISDELRKEARDLGGYIETLADAKELDALADRIDAEMVELPRDMNDVPIHVGDTVYGCRSGMKMTISELRMTTNGLSISTSRGYLNDAEVTHEYPDSFGRIADELEEWSEDNRVNGDDEIFSRAREIADRIRRLAERE